MDYSKATVIVPTLNEARNVSKLINLISGSYRGIKVVVADDGSTDGTAEIVKKIGRSRRNVKLLDRSGEKTHGLTASVVDAAKHVGTEFIVVMDGDLQHPPEKIKEIAEKLESGSDLVIGTRRKVIGEWPLQRRLMSIAATNLARARLMRLVEDPMSGFFGIRSGLFKKIIAEKEGEFEMEGYKVMFDLLKHLPKKSVVSKVYYDFGERAGGESKIRAKHVLAMLRSLLR